MVFKKKQVVMLAMTVVVCVAVYLNWQFNNTNDDLTVTESLENNDNGKVLGEAQLVSTGADDVEASSTADYFVEAKLNRQKTRDASIEILTSVSENTNNNEDVRKKAATDIGTIATMMEKETKVENLIIGKGFSNALAVLSNSSITVMVKSAGLKQNEIAQIKEIVIEETGLKADSIHIVEIK